MPVTQTKVSFSIIDNKYISLNNEKNHLNRNYFDSTMESKSNQQGIKKFWYSRSFRR